jgi:hypothetical protein
MTPVDEMILAGVHDSPRDGKDGMTPPNSQGAVAQVRPVWLVTPLESVGPLRFGMTVEDAAAALPEAPEFRRFQAGPYDPQIVGLELGFRHGEPAVYEYFDDSGQLFCIAADAIHGPQMTLDGTKLTGGNPVDLEQWLLGLHNSLGGVRYGPRANPGINELGLVLRVQGTADGLRTRPVLVGRDWADRCTDDWEGAIPECEFIGPVWPDPRFPDREKIWPPAGCTPTWADKWSPPF